MYDQLPYFINKPNPAYYLERPYVVLDLETSNKSKGSAIEPNNRIVLSVVKYKDVTTTLNTSGELHDYLKDKLDFILVAHNAKFELQWLQRIGIDISKVLVFDTLLAEYVLAGNRRVPLDLGSVAHKRGAGHKDPFIDLCMKGGVCPSDMPRSLLERRCRKDVLQTEVIFLQQRQELLESDRLKTLYTRCLFTPVLADIEFNGLCLDGDKVEETYREYTERLNELSEALGRLSNWINLRSPKQKAEFFYDTLGFSEPTDRRGNPIRTSTGNRRTDSATIAGFKARNRRQREFIKLYQEYNKINAAVSKNLEFFEAVVKDHNCIFTGSFNQSVTQTHRLSASGRPIDIDGKPKSVQFQNLPRQFKELFTARSKGWVVGEIDGSQLEFRVAAHLGRDKVATDAIVNDLDVHSYTAEVLTANGEPTERQEAKAHTFKPFVKAA